MEIIQNIDQSILIFIQNNICNPVLDEIMTIVTSLGNSGVIWIVITIILLVIKKYRKYGIIMFISLILCLIIGNVVLKNLVARLRPCHIDSTVNLLIGIPIDYSFPSGHSMVSFASAGVLWYMKKEVGIISMSLAITIAFSRMYLYVHYPSDVLCGAIVGLLIALLSIKLVSLLQKNKRKKYNIFI